MQTSFMIFNIMLLTVSFIGWSEEKDAVGDHRREASGKSLEKE